MTYPDLNGFPAGSLLGVAAGIAASFLCFLVLRLDFARAKRNQMDVLTALELDLRRELAECRAESAEQVAQVHAGVESLRQSIPAAEVPPSESFRPPRSQAIQLLRSGMSPEAAARKLDLPLNEVRLIAKIARALSGP